MSHEDKIIEINGEKFYTVSSFARIVNKSENAIYGLIYHGNKVRKLRAKKFWNKPMIYASELTEYPFTLPGKGKLVYYYDSEGNQSEMTTLEGSNDY